MIFFFEGFFDERFLVHRLKATRFAAVVTVLSMAAYLTWEFFTKDLLRGDLLVFLAILGAAKVAAMAYYRMTD